VHDTALLLDAAVVAMFGFATACVWFKFRNLITRIRVSGGVGTVLHGALCAALLHQRFGFVETARFNKNGRKLGRYWDIAWLGKRLE